MLTFRRKIPAASMTPMYWGHEVFYIVEILFTLSMIKGQSLYSRKVSNFCNKVGHCSFVPCILYSGLFLFIKSPVPPSLHSGEVQAREYKCYWKSRPLRNDDLEMALSITEWKWIWSSLQIQNDLINDTSDQIWKTTSRLPGSRYVHCHTYMYIHMYTENAFMHLSIKKILQCNFNRTGYEINRR